MMADFCAICGTVEELTEHELVVPAGKLAHFCPSCWQDYCALLGVKDAPPRGGRVEGVRVKSSRVRRGMLDS